jgi:hypothetical protein
MIYTASEMVDTVGRGESSYFWSNLVINQLQRELQMKSAACAALEHKSGELQLNIDILTRVIRIRRSLHPPGRVSRMALNERSLSKNSSVIPLHRTLMLAAKSRTFDKSDVPTST